MLHNFHNRLLNIQIISFYLKHQICNEVVVNDLISIPQKELNKNNYKISKSNE